jgi:hypothetical protein
MLNKRSLGALFLLGLDAIDSGPVANSDVRVAFNYGIDRSAKVSPKTVKRDWRFAKSRLHRVLSGDKGDEAGAFAAS